MRITTQIASAFLIVVFVHTLPCSADDKVRLDMLGPSNIIAAVVGYQTTRKLECGIEVPLFSTDKEAGNGSEKGVLFYIVAPTNLMGKFFWMDFHSTWEMSPSAIRYNKDKLYYFAIGNRELPFGKAYFMALDSDEGVNIHPHELFDIGGTNLVCCRNFLEKEYYPTVVSCENDIQRLIDRRQTNAVALAKARERLKQVPQPPTTKDGRHTGVTSTLRRQFAEYYRLREDILWLSNSVLPGIEFHLNLAKEQLKNFKAEDHAQQGGVPNASTRR